MEEVCPHTEQAAKWPAGTARMSRCSSYLSVKRSKEAKETKGSHILPLQSRKASVFCDESERCGLPENDLDIPQCISSARAIKY